MTWHVRFGTWRYINSQINYLRYSWRSMKTMSGQQGEKARELPLVSMGRFIAYDWLYEQLTHGSRPSLDCCKHDFSASPRVRPKALDLAYPTSPHPGKQTFNEMLLCNQCTWCCCAINAHIEVGCRGAGIQSRGHGRVKGFLTWIPSNSPVLQCYKSSTLLNIVPSINKYEHLWNQQN